MAHSRVVSLIADERASVEANRVEVVKIKN